MVKELIKAGYTGQALKSEVMRLTGLSAEEAQELINIETGVVDSDVYDEKS